MSPENAEIALRQIDALNRRDVDAFVAFVSPEVEWEDSGFWSERARIYRGRAGVREWFDRVVVEPWKSLHVEVGEIVKATDDRLFGEMILTARGKGSGVEAPGLRFWGVLWFANGEITRRRVFLERSEALAAAGLPEKAISRSNVELMMDAYAAINRGDLEAFLALIDPEVEFSSLIAELDGQTYRGHAGVAEWWKQLKSSLGGLHYEAEGVRDLGDCTVAKLLVNGRAGGVAVPQSMWCATRIRNRRAIWWGVYRTEAEALEAAAWSD